MSFLNPTIMNPAFDTLFPEEGEFVKVDNLRETFSELYLSFSKTPSM